MNDEFEIRALRERVSKLEAEMRFLYKHVGVTFVQPAFELDPADREVAEFIKKGDDLKAMQAYRGVHKVSAVEAKAAVDAIRAGLGL
ncbi:MAG: hypothetical protein HFACDABA_00337 [Anaerolineales bacterium]|nr:hypothetical protein [Anaerolineales bacterium]